MVALNNNKIIYRANAMLLSIMYLDDVLKMYFLVAPTNDVFLSPMIISHQEMRNFRMRK